MKYLIIIALLALGAASCTTKESEVTPLYDVTFVGMNNTLDVVNSLSGRVSDVPDNINEEMLFQVTGDYGLVNMSVDVNIDTFKVDLNNTGYRDLSNSHKILTI